MFEFPVLDEAALQDLAEIDARRAVYRRKEALAQKLFAVIYGRQKIFLLRRIRDDYSRCNS